MKKRIVKSRQGKPYFNKNKTDKSSSEDIKRIIIQNDESISEKKNLILNCKSEWMTNLVPIKTYAVCKQPIIHCCNKYMVDTVHLTSRIKESLNKEIFNGKLRPDSSESIFNNFKNIPQECHYSYTPLKVIDRCYKTHKSFHKAPILNKYRKSFRIFESFKGILYVKQKAVKTEVAQSTKHQKPNLEKEYTVTMPINRLSDNVIKMVDKNEEIEELSQVSSKLTERYNIDTNSFETLEVEMEKLLERKYSPQYQIMPISPKIFITDSYKTDRPWPGAFLSTNTTSNPPSILFKESSISNVELPNSNIINISTETPKKGLMKFKPFTSFGTSISKHKPVPNFDINPLSKLFIGPSNSMRKESKKINPFIYTSNKPILPYFERVFPCDDEIDLLQDESKDIQLSILYTEMFLEKANKIVERSFSGGKRYDRKHPRAKVIEYYGNFGCVDGIELSDLYLSDKISEMETYAEIMITRESFRALSHMYNLRMLVAKSSNMDKDDEDPTGTLESFLRNQWFDGARFSSRSSSTVSSNYSLGPIDNDLVQAFTKKLSTASYETLTSKHDDNS